MTTPFEQYESQRSYLAGVAAPVSHWPTLAITSPARALLSPAKGIVLALLTNSSLAVLPSVGQVGRIMGQVDAGALVTVWAIDAATFGVGACTRTGCQFYKCVSMCQASAAVKHNFSGISSLVATPDGTLVIGASAGILFASPSGKVRKVVLGGDDTGVSALAIGLPINTGRHIGQSGIGSSYRLAAATSLAVYTDFEADTGMFATWQLIGAQIDAVPTSLAFVDGDLWVGSASCLNVLRASGAVERVSGAQGLPMRNISALSVHGLDLWIISPSGVALHRPLSHPPETRWRYFAGDRWLPTSTAVPTLGATSGGRSGAPVTAIVAIDGAMSGAPNATRAAWVATASGLALLYSRNMTLEEKAFQYETDLEMRLTRHKLVGGGMPLSRYGDKSSGVPSAGDNDGLWTSMLTAGYAFKWQVTGDADARAKGWDHFTALEFLHNVTSVDGKAPLSGFLARTVAACGELHEKGDSTICPPSSPNSCGWVNSSACFAGTDGRPPSASSVSVGEGRGRGDGCCWVYKRDTSSDEVAGHFFGLLVTHQFLAESDAERGRVARVLCSTATALLENDYNLIDPTSGRRTTWGYWGPEALRHAPGERGGNSLQALGFLAAAVRVCGASAAPKFGAAFVDLVRSHGYDRNLVNALVTQPDGLALFDFRLAALAYLTLYIAAPGLATASSAEPPPDAISLTKSELAALHARLSLSVSRYWAAPDATVTGQTTGPVLLSVPYALITGKPIVPTVAAEADPFMQLRRYPSELVNWPAANSRRLDIELLPDWRACCNQLMLSQALPADEAPFEGADFVSRGASDRVDGGNGLNWASTSPWLLYFWMARYYDVK